MLTVFVDAPSSTRTILIVDDDPSVTATFQRILQLEGYDVLTALTAEMGLEQAYEHWPAAIIVDLRMPLVDGVQFLRALRSRPEHAMTPVAIVTGDYFLDDQLSSQLQSLGAEVRYKPLWLKELMDLARLLLKRSPTTNPH
jgi:DNA-binding response OmpR family regulator